jgi:hypothetical protein
MTLTNTDCVREDWGEAKWPTKEQVENQVRVQVRVQVLNQVFYRFIQIPCKIIKEINK